MHVDEDSCIMKRWLLKVDGNCGREKPRKTWDEIVKIHVGGM